jgi:DNA (cytosine-5)-methyltransferase 1
VKIDGDIRKLDRLPEGTELLCGGFPCQPFSNAGKRKGLDEERGTLFGELARLAEHSKPRLLFFENVAGLLSAQEGYAFAYILSRLDEIGYDLQWQVLNSKHFGVPQSRERVFIIGHLRGTPRPEVFPIREGDEVADGVAGQADCGGQGIQAKDTASALDAHAAKGWGGGRTLISGVAWRTRTLAGQPGHYEVRNDGVANQLTTVQKDSMMYSGSSSIRRLTPLECERLQGFPDGWTEGVSETQRYKMCGNAVTVNVIEAIARRLE